MARKRRKKRAPWSRVSTGVLSRSTRKGTAFVSSAFNPKTKAAGSGPGSRGSASKIKAKPFRAAVVFNDGTDKGLGRFTTRKKASRAALRALKYRK